MHKPAMLSRDETEKTENYSIVDGAGYNVMSGFGEQYITPFALQLGATNAQIGVLASLPAFFGSFFQILGARLADKFQERKRMVVWFVLLQAILIIPLFIVPFLTRSIIVLTGFMCAYLIIGNILSPAWHSWIGQVVREDERAQYFAKRNKILLIVLLFSVICAGAILNYFESVNIFVGFAILFALAFAGRFVSFVYLSKQFEPQYRPPMHIHFSFTEFLHRLPHTNFGKFTLFRSLMMFAVMVGSPFFAVYALRNLNMSYLSYTALLLTPMIGKILTMNYWGRYSEKFGNKRIMFVSGFLIALVPFWWFLFGTLTTATLLSPNTTWILLCIAEFIGGIAWGGFDLTTFNYMFETAKPQMRAHAFAYYNVLLGFATLFGGVLGSYLAGHLHTVSMFGIIFPALIIVFLCSTFIRGFVVLRFVNTLQEVRINEQIAEGKLFFDLLVARPLHSAVSGTLSSVIFAEHEFAQISERTGKLIWDVSKPISPFLEWTVDSIDRRLTGVEDSRTQLFRDDILNHTSMQGQKHERRNIHVEQTMQYMPPVHIKSPARKKNYKNRKKYPERVHRRTHPRK